MRWLADLVWRIFVRKWVFFEVARISFSAVLSRPYNTTQEQDIDLALAYTENFMRQAEARFLKLEGDDGRKDEGLEAGAGGVPGQA